MSHLFRAALAASMLVGIGTACAGEAANGQDPNGWRLNGVSLNALGINGIQLNRLAFNGSRTDTPPQLSGIPLDRIGLR